VVALANAVPVETVIGYGNWRLALHRVNRLTPREYEVFRMLAAGLPYRDMAERLFVSERTVRAHLAAIIDKLDLECVLHARLASYGYNLHCAVAAR
jgi:DNA-binding NarL/FixJ family response regulator